MSDFLFSTAPQPPGRLGAILSARLAALPARVEERHDSRGTLAWAALPHDGAVVTERDGTLDVLIGEPLPVAAGASERTPPFDGPFALLTLTESGGRVTTDLMAFIPVFWANGPRGGLVIGTHVDAVAIAAERVDHFDPVSGADFLANGSIMYPHTLYDGVEQMAPAAYWRFERGEWTSREQYWTPHERNPFGSLRDAAAELQRALGADVAHAVARGDTAGMLLSAGEDSRAVLGAVPRDVSVRAFTFADWDSREVGIARRIARAYGADFEVGLRSFGQTIEALEPVASFVGSQHQYIDVHAWGLQNALGLDHLPVVLGGFSSDVLLKAYYSPTKARRSQPQKKHPRENDPLRVGRAGGVRRELLEAATERRERRRAELRAIRPESATEWMWIWPFSGRRPAAAYVGQRRLFRSHEPFMSNAIVRTSAAVPVGWKLDRRLFRDAMRPFLRSSRYVPHARNMFPYFGLYANVPLGAGLALGRFARDAVSGRLGRHQGPWEDRHALVRSELFVERLRRYPIDAARARVLFEADSVEAIEQTVRRWGPKRQMMFLQLSYATAEDSAR